MKSSPLLLLALLVGIATLPVHAQKEGKKKRIAVFAFDDKTDNRVGWYSQRSVGEGIADMVITELVKTGQYRVLERQELNALLAEQDLGQSGIVTPETAAEVGKVLGVELAVMGAVTEFGYKENNNGVRIGGTNLGVGMMAAVTAVDIRIVNTSTGEILQAENIRRTKRAPSGSFSKGRIAFQSQQELDQSVVGKSAREAVEDVVALVARNADAIPWSAKVVTEQSGKVFINSGANDGVRVGDVFFVYRDGEALVDPDTGLKLGAIQAKVGKLQVADASVGEGKASLCTILEGSGFQRGDVVKEQ